MKKIIYDSNEEDIHKLLKILIHPQHIHFCKCNKISVEIRRYRFFVYKRAKFKNFMCRNKPLEISKT